MYQNRTEGDVIFFDTNYSNSSQNFHLEPGLYHSFTDVLEAMKTLNQERHNHTETSIALKMSRKTQKVSLTSQAKDQGLNILVRTWVTFFEALLAIALEFCRERKNFTSQCLLMTQLAYILS